MATRMKPDELARLINNYQRANLHFHVRNTPNGLIRVRMTAKLYNSNQYPYQYEIVSKTGGGTDLVCECFNELIKCLSPQYFYDLYERYGGYKLYRTPYVELHDYLGVLYNPHSGIVKLQNRGLNISVELAMKMGYHVIVSTDENNEYNITIYVG